MGAPVLFLSTTPPELEAVRLETARLLDASGYVVLHPPVPSPSDEETASEDVTYAERLRSVLRKCDSVVQLLGFSLGPEEGGEADGVVRRRSHAELERAVAREMALPCYSFVLDEEFPCEEFPGKNDPSAQVLQFRYRARVKAEPQGWEAVRDMPQLTQRMRLLPSRFEELRLASAEQVAPSATVKAQRQGPHSVAQVSAAATPNVPASPPTASPDAHARVDGNAHAENNRGISTSTSTSTSRAARVVASGKGKGERKTGVAIAVVLSAAVVAAVTAFSLKGGTAVTDWVRNTIPKVRSVDSASPPRGEEQQLQPVNTTGIATDEEPRGTVAAAPASNPDATEGKQEFAQTEVVLEEVLKLALLLGDSGDSHSPKDWMTVAIRLVKRRHSLSDADYENRVKSLENTTLKSDTDLLSRRTRILCDIASWKLEQALEGCVEYLREAGAERRAVQDATMMLGHVHQLMGDDSQAAVQYAEVFKTVDAEEDSQRWCDVVHLLLFTGMKGGKLELVYDLFSDEPMRKVLKLREKQFGKDSLEVLASLRLLGNHLVSQPGRSEEATELLRRALVIAEAHRADKDTPEVAAICADLAKSLRSPIPVSSRKGLDPNLQEIIALQERSLHVNEEWYGRESAQVATDLVEQAQTQEKIPRLDKAESLYRNAIRIREKLEIDLDRGSVGSITGLGRILMTTDREGEAEELLKAAVEKSLQRKQLSYLTKAIVIDSLAGLYEKQGDIAKLEPLLRRAMALHCPKFGPAAIMRASLMKKMSDLLCDTKREEEAIPVMRDTEQWLVLAYGAGDVIVPMAIKQFAQVLASVGQGREAEEQWLRGIALMEKQPREKHETLCALLYGYGRLLLDTRRAKEGEQMLQRAVEVDLYCKNHPEKGLPALILTQHLTDKGEYEKALDLMRDSMGMMVKVRGNRDPRSILCLYSYSRTQMDAGYVEGAKETLELTIQCYEKALGPDDPHVADVLHSLSLALKKLGRRGEQERVLRRALSIRSRIQDKEKDDQKDLEAAREKYGSMLLENTRLTRAQIQSRMDKIEAGEPVAELGLK